jgi:hypothetical protein
MYLNNGDKEIKKTYRYKEENEEKYEFYSRAVSL